MGAGSSTPHVMGQDHNTGFVFMRKDQPFDQAMNWLTDGQHVTDQGPGMYALDEQNRMDWMNPSWSCHAATDSAAHHQVEMGGHGGSGSDGRCVGKTQHGRQPKAIKDMCDAVWDPQRGGYWVKEVESALHPSQMELPPGPCRVLRRSEWHEHDNHDDYHCGCNEPETVVVRKVVKKKKKPVVVESSESSSEEDEEVVKAPPRPPIVIMPPPPPPQPQIFYIPMQQPASPPQPAPAPPPQQTTFFPVIAAQRPYQYETQMQRSAMPSNPCGMYGGGTCAILQPF